MPGGKAGPGKVTLTVQNRTVECEAFTAAADIPTGAAVRVVAVRGTDGRRGRTGCVSDASYDASRTHRRLRHEHPSASSPRSTVDRPAACPGRSSAPRPRRSCCSASSSCSPSATSAARATASWSSTARPAAATPPSASTAAAAFVMPAHPGLRLPHPRADPDRDPAQGRAVDREHPRQRARASSPSPSAPTRRRCRTPPSACSGLDTDEIKQQAGDIIFGQLRQVIASMRIEDINRDRDKFLQNIQTSLEPELKKIGLVLINVNITDITDESGYIEAIGRKAAVDGDPAGQDRRGRAGEAGPDRRRRGRARAGDPGRQRRPSCARSAPARRPRAGRPRGRAREGDRRSASRRPLLEREALIKEVAAAAGGPHRRAGPRPEGRRADGGVRARSRRSPTPTARCASRLADANAKAIAGEAHGPGRRSPRRRPSLQVQAGRGVPARRDDASARPRPRCWRRRTGRRPRRPLAEAEKIEAEQRAALEAPGQGREGAG